MDEQGRGSWKRRFNMYAPLAAVAVGLIIVLSSLLVENMTAWYATVGAGVVVVLVGFWYAAHPIFTSTRVYTALRAEVNQFISLVRDLNSAAVSGFQGERERVKAAMLESVQRMDEVADKEN